MDITTPGAAGGHAARRHRRQPWRAVDPARDIQAFAADLFGVARGDPDCPSEKDALWSVTASSADARSVAATTEYGTERANGVWLLEQALNLKTPEHLRHRRADGKEDASSTRRQTLAAREKQKRIKEQFRAGFSPIPTARSGWSGFTTTSTTTCACARFDGSHLTFPA